MHCDDSRPFYLCEYCHSMGLGPGSFKEYWELIYKYEKFIGGCVWEWCDHAACHADGKYRYTYGGDHSEYVHDGNFCCDGVMYPDRTPSTRAFEMKDTYRPVRFSLLRAEDGCVELEAFHTRNFIDTSGDSFEYELLQNGAVAARGDCRLSLAPYSKSAVKLALPLPAQGSLS